MAVSIEQTSPSGQQLPAVEVHEGITEVEGVSFSAQQQFFSWLNSSTLCTSCSANSLGGVGGGRGREVETKGGN